MQNQRTEIACNYTKKIRILILNYIDYTDIKKIYFGSFYFGSSYFEILKGISMCSKWLFLLRFSGQ